MLTDNESKELDILKQLQSDHTRPMLQHEWDRLTELNKKRFVCDLCGEIISPFVEVHECKIVT